MRSPWEVQNTDIYFLYVTTKALDALSVSQCTPKGKSNGWHSAMIPSSLSLSLFFKILLIFLFVGLLIQAHS